MCVVSYCFVVASQLSHGKIRCSVLFKQFLAGWLAHAAELIVFFAPTINSFKRYLDGSWY